MMKYKAVIFDLDGTLLDTLDDLTDAVNHTMTMFGYPERTREEIRQFVGNGVTRLLELSTPDGLNNPHFDEILKEYRKYYPAHSEIKTGLYPGVSELISKLHDTGIKTAVVSNKQHDATVHLCSVYLPEIEVSFGERESEGIRRKPYPDTVIISADALGVALNDCVYIGDSEVDIKTARNAGIDCISVLWGFRDEDYLKECGADVFAHNCDELYDAILGA